MDQLILLYSEYDASMLGQPDSMGDIRRLCREWRGREEQLVSDLQAKYESERRRAAGGGGGGGGGGGDGETTAGAAKKSLKKGLKSVFGFARRAKAGVEAAKSKAESALKNALSKEVR